MGKLRDDDGPMEPLVPTLCVGTRWSFQYPVSQPGGQCFLRRFLAVIDIGPVHAYAVPSVAITSRENRNPIMAQIRLSKDEADGHLPAVCMRCGQEATTTTSKRMQWCPPWVGALILFGLLPYLIVAVILTRRATVQAPFCEDHKRHWFNRALLMWSTFFLFGLVGVGGLVLVGSLENQQLKEQLMPFSGLTCLVGVVGWLIIVIVCQNMGIRPKEITDDEILLTGVSDAFVEAVTEGDRERKERRAARRREGGGRWRDDADADDDGDAPPRKKKRAPDDRIEEAD
jgi:hypothetical protein